MMQTYKQKKEQLRRTRYSRFEKSDRALFRQTTDKISIRKPLHTNGNHAVQRLLQADQIHAKKNSSTSGEVLPGLLNQQENKPPQKSDVYAKTAIEMLNQNKFSKPASKINKPTSPGDAHEQEADQLADQVLSKAGVENKPGDLSTRAASNNLHNKPLTSAVNKVISSSGQSLESTTRGYFDSRFGVPLDQVRVHTGDLADRAAKSLQAQAFTLGNNIVFEKGKYSPLNVDGKKLLAHELAHVVLPGHVGIKRTVSPDYDQIEDDMTYGLFDWAVTDANVQSTLSILAGLNTTDLADTLAQMRTDGYVSRLLDNITNAELITFLQTVQRSGATAFAAGQGLASQADMAQAQATMMQARNTAAAAAAHGPTPTPAQVSAQQSSQVASTSIAPRVATLSPADEITHNTAATAAVSTFVTWVQSAHPELNITAANIRVDSRAVFDRGQNVVAFGQGGKAVVGQPFTMAVTADPAYALAVIVHELHGHPQYGPYGAAGTELGLELYDQASALMPGYTQPTGAGRTAEIDAYAYQETEIYSLMVSLPYYTPVTAAHSALSSVNFDPAPTISTRIGIIKNQFEPRVAQSLIRGLWMRLRLDPRLQPAALTAFRAGVTANFTTAEATAILL